MMPPPISPEQWHEKRHSKRLDCSPVFEECWRCQRSKSHCKSKIRFITWEEAREWVEELNQSREYVNPVYRYPCRWCSGWHMSSADGKGPNGKTKARRVERERRRWLIQKRVGSGQRL